MPKTKAIIAGINAKFENGNTARSTASIEKINPKKYTVSYVVATYKPREKHLPLFAKIALMKAVKGLREKGYNVTLNFIQKQK